MSKNKEQIENRNVESVNMDFYNKLYKKRSPLLQLIYPFISYDQQSKSKPNFKAMKFTFKNLKANEEFNFLDYGFGHGSLLLKIPRKNGLFGCDISIEAVTNFPGVAKLLGKTVKTFTPEQLHLTHTRFNMVSMSHVLEHVDDDLALLKELQALMAPNGFILINVPINEVWDDPKHVRKYTSLSMQDVLKKAGFAITSVQEKNKLSGFLLMNERVKKPNLIKKIFFRSFRLFLAIMPLAVLESFDFILSDKYKRQHLIVLARKNG